MSNKPISVELLDVKNILNNCLELIKLEGTIGPQKKILADYYEIDISEIEYSSFTKEFSTNNCICTIADDQDELVEALEDQLDSWYRELTEDMPECILDNLDDCDVKESLCKDVDEIQKQLEVEVIKTDGIFIIPQ